MGFVEIAGLFGLDGKGPYSFVHCDGDLYSTTKAAIEYFYPRLSPWGVMVFDDYGFATTPGCKRALEESGLDLEIPGTGQAIVRKIRAASGL